MTPNLKQTALTLDPVGWRARVVFSDEDIVVTIEFPFHPEYDMAFARVRTLAEQRALELLAGARKPQAD
ncbi:hypothetical protein D3C87_1255140 [compost metagenome]